MNLTTSELAFVSIGATLVGVVIGGVITYKVTDRQVRSSETEGKLQREHDASQRQLERHMRFSYAIKRGEPSLTGC